MQYNSPDLPNSLSISLVEENSELAKKTFSQERVNLLPPDVKPTNTYTYNSSLKNPFVLKIEIITQDKKTLTFLAKETLKQDQRHRITLGIIYHDPNILRIYYSNDRKQFSLTQEYTLLPFLLEPKALVLFDRNNNVTGGRFQLFGFRVNDSFFDFYQTWRFPESFLKECYRNADSLFFNQSNSTFKLAGLSVPQSKVTESKFYFNWFFYFDLKDLILLR